MAPSKLSSNARYEDIHVCTIIWKNNDFKTSDDQSVDKESEVFRDWMKVYLAATCHSISLETKQGHRPEENLIEELNRVYGKARDAKEKGKKQLMVLVYSGHGCKGPIKPDRIPATKYKPHPKAKINKDEPDNGLPEFERFYWYDKNPEVKNKQAVKDKFEEPEADINTGPTAILDWGYVWWQLKKPTELVHWIIFNSCQSGSMLLREKMDIKAKAEFVQGVKDGTKTVVAPAYLHYFCAVGPGLARRTGKTSFLKMVQSGMIQAYKDGKGEFTIKQVWKSIAGSNETNNIKAEDFDLWEEEDKEVRKDQQGFERMIGIDEMNVKKTRAKKREDGKDAEDVPNAVSDWRLPYMGSVPIGWDDSTKLKIFYKKAKGIGPSMEGSGGSSYG